MDAHKRTMKKILILIFLCLALVSVFLAGATFFFVRNFSLEEHFKAKLEVPLNYKIGWWAHQDNLEIKEFSVEIVKSNRNMFSMESLIRYKISGELTGKNRWAPYIKEVHVSERFIEPIDRTVSPVSTRKEKLPEAIIEITPIVEAKSSSLYSGGKIKFSFTNEHVIESFHWGENLVRLKCGAFQKDITLHQNK